LRRWKSAGASAYSSSIRTPEQKLWQSILATYASKITPIRLSEVSDPTKYPESLYVAKLEVLRSNIVHAVT
jgi:hypothetical protein